MQGKIIHLINSGACIFQQPLPSGCWFQVSDFLTQNHSFHFSLSVFYGYSNYILSMLIHILWAFSLLLWIPPPHSFLKIAIVDPSSEVVSHVFLFSLYYSTSSTMARDFQHACPVVLFVFCLFVCLLCWLVSFLLFSNTNKNIVALPSKFTFKSFYQWFKLKRNDNSP